MLPQFPETFETISEVEARVSINICSEELKVMFGDMGFKVIRKARLNQAFVGLRLDLWEGIHIAEEVVTSFHSS